MAGFFQQVLKGAAEGLFNDAYLRDFRHASKTFTTNGFANAPKFKYLFHVYFNINQSLVNTTAFPDAEVPGLLVKNITLPKFAMQIAEMNQYNRKRYVQTKITYDPISVAFHDDNAGAIKKMWYNYYSYYYSDPISIQNKTNTKVKNLYSINNTNDQNWGYMGEPSNSSGAAALSQPKPQFFDSIVVYGFNQHNFSAYELINPIIERFEHDTYDYYQPNGTMENRMTIRYEGVNYQEGALDGTNPGNKVTGFGSDQYYDRLLSPISKPGANKNIMGQGGLVDGVGGIMDALNKVPPDILGAATKGLNIAKTWKNPQNILTAAKEALVVGATTAASNPDIGRSIFTFAAQGATAVGAAVQAGRSQNVPNTQAPAIKPTQ